MCIVCVCVCVWSQRRTEEGVRQFWAVVWVLGMKSGFSYCSLLLNHLFGITEGFWKFLNLCIFVWVWVILYHHIYAGVRASVSSLATRVINNCELPCGHQKLNLHPLYEQLSVHNHWANSSATSFFISFLIKYYITLIRYLLLHMGCSL